MKKSVLYGGSGGLLTITRDKTKDIRPEFAKRRQFVMSREKDLVTFVGKV